MAAPGPPAPPGLRLIVTGSRISGNTGTNSGAGIANDGGTAVVTGSTLSGNKAGQSPGGAIANYGPITLSHDTLSGNQAAYGGALEAAYAGTPGQQVVLESTLAGNKALAGGAIDDATDTLYVTASTLAGNSANLGGGIEVEGASFVYLRSSTLTGNTARSGTGGAIDTYACGGGVVSYTTIAGNSSGLNLPCSNLEVTGSIIASSAPGPNCAGAAPHEAAGIQPGHRRLVRVRQADRHDRRRPATRPARGQRRPDADPGTGERQPGHRPRRHPGHRLPGYRSAGRAPPAGAGLRHRRRRGAGRAADPSQRRACHGNRAARAAGLAGRRSA